MLEGALIGLDAEWESVNEMREEAKKKGRAWSDANSAKWQDLERQLALLTSQLKQATARRDELDPKYDWTCTQVRLARKDMEKYADKLADLRRLEKQEKDLKSGPTRCPTCGQALVRAGLTETRRSIAEQIKGLREATSGASELARTIEVLDADTHSLKAELDAGTAWIAQLEAKRVGVAALMDQREEEPNPYHEQAQSLRKRLIKIKADLKEGKAAMGKLARKAERAKFWVKGFKDVRLHVIGEVLEELELATNAALDDVGLVGWSVHFDVEKETKSGTVQRGLNVLIGKPGLKERVRWESWSGGESQRLRIVGALALSEVLLSHAGVQTDLEILDEPAHFMAPEGVRDVTDMLAARADSLGKQTWYIDHMAIESSRFASVTTVVRDKEGARLE